MIAKKQIPEPYLNWNKEKDAPFGKKILNKKIGSLIPKKIRLTKLGSKLCGKYFFQPNSKTRTYEYPWAFYASGISKNSKILEIGGGLSGFQFDLSTTGAEVHNVDPGLEAKGKGWPVTTEIISKMNNNFGTDVKLHSCFIEEAKFESESFDLIYSISVIEHIVENEFANLCKEISRILKPGGLFIATIDLFLNLFPFTDIKENNHGKNMSIKSILDYSNLTLVYGNKEELFGFDEFNSDNILKNLDEYFCIQNVLVQTIILKKE